MDLEASKSYSRWSTPFISTKPATSVQETKDSASKDSRSYNSHGDVQYMRHTSQDVTVASPTDHRRSSSSSTSTGSRIPGPPQTSPHSSVQQWLDALDTPAPPPPASVALPSQPVSMCAAVTSSMPLGYSASQMAPQRVHSSHHSQTSRRSRFSTTSATVIQGMMDFSSQMTNNLAHLAEGVRADGQHQPSLLSLIHI